LEREAQTRELVPEDRRGLRQDQARPLLVEFHDWLERQAKLALPKSPLGDALGYALRQWTPLTRYLEDGRLPIDNNGAERALRRVAVGRNNWIFAGSDHGGERAAIHYSPVQTCKENGIDPWEYLTDVFERVSTHPNRLIEELTPRGWKASRPG